MQLYIAAFYLFERGKSHPQIVSLLTVLEPDTQLVSSLVDKAMHEEWDKLYLEAKRLFADGVSKDKVIEVFSKTEPDIEIVSWICEEWYELKFRYMECLNEGSINLFEGIKGIVICSIGLAFLFYAKFGWIAKAIWTVALIATLVQWLVGFEQRKIAKKIDNLFTSDV